MQHTPTTLDVDGSSRLAARAAANAHAAVALIVPPSDTPARHNSTTKPSSSASRINARDNSIISTGVTLN